LHSTTAICVRQPSFDEIATALANNPEIRQCASPAIRTAGLGRVQHATRSAANAVKHTWQQRADNRLIAAGKGESNWWSTATDAPADLIACPSPIAASKSRKSRSSAGLGSRTLHRPDAVQHQAGRIGFGRMFE
jgi:hypothetical protein